MVPEAFPAAEQLSNQLFPCSTCGRTFLPLPLKKHAPVCEKNASKRRKIFDSRKQRIAGTDIASFCEKLDQKDEAVTKINKWAESHEKLVDVIRTAKGRSRAISPKKTSSLQNTNERCPFCDRQFGIKAYDRHVEWCKEHKACLYKSPTNCLAKERLEARIKYKVPPLPKLNKTVMKEKDYPGSSTICNVKSTPVLKKRVTIKKPKSELDMSNIQTMITPNSIKKETAMGKSQRKNGHKCNVKETAEYEHLGRPQDLFSADDELYEEYKIHEDLYLREKEKEKLLRNHTSINTIKSSRLEGIEQKDTKMSDDSAYGSVHRVSPRTTNSFFSQFRRMDSRSSSASDTVLSPVACEDAKMSKYCHECGTKHPLATAKFCVECGVRRLML